MKCPYCGQEMEEGYIQCRDSVCWSRKKRIVAAIGPFDDSSIKLGEGNGPFSGTAVVACRCSGCKKIIIDYSGR